MVDRCLIFEIKKKKIYKSGTYFRTCNVIKNNFLDYLRYILINVKIQLVFKYKLINTKLDIADINTRGYFPHK